MFFCNLILSLLGDFLYVWDVISECFLFNKYEIIMCYCIEGCVYFNLYVRCVRILYVFRILVMFLNFRNFGIVI